MVSMFYLLFRFLVFKSKKKSVLPIVLFICYYEKNHPQFLKSKTTILLSFMVLWAFVVPCGESDVGWDWMYLNIRLARNSRWHLHLYLVYHQPSSKPPLTVDFPGLIIWKLRAPAGIDKICKNSHWPSQVQGGEKNRCSPWRYGKLMSTSLQTSYQIFEFYIIFLQLSFSFFCLIVGTEKSSLLFKY